MKFNELPFHESLRKALDKIGYTELTPIQAKSIPFAMEGNDLTGLAQTGTGKTMAFLLPTLHRLLSAEEEEALPYALVLAPTRELTIQIAEEEKTPRVHRLWGGYHHWRNRLQVTRTSTWKQSLHYRGNTW